MEGLVWAAGAEGDDEAHYGGDAGARGASEYVCVLRWWDWGREGVVWGGGGGGAYNSPTVKMAKTPILRLVGILSLEMR